MRFIFLTNAKPGMRLAYDVYDSYGRTLIGGDCVLTGSYIEKLQSYGFDGVYVEDEYSQDIEVERVITPELRAEGLACIRKRDIDGCHRIARHMVEQIMEKSNLSLDMTDLRTYDDYTYAHSVNVAVVSGVIGIGFSLREDELEQLVSAALLHDLGKLSIPAEILNKPERLTPEEYQIMKTHAELSYQLISQRLDFSSNVKTAVRFHHENEDGSGYPLGLEGSEMTLFTKILHVADVYDALTSKRPYKNPYSPYEASEYLMGGCGILFNQKVVETLLQFVPLYPKGTQVTLSNGVEGIIFENEGFHNLRPIVRTFDGTLLDMSETRNLSLTIISSINEGMAAPEVVEQGRKEMVKPVEHDTIAIVDDMKANLHMLQNILQDQYDVVLLKSGHQLIKYLQKNPQPKLVLMDIDMPEMNGVEAAREVQKMTDGTLPILFVTAISDRETVKACRELHAAGYILRPYKPVYIKSEIKRIITGRSEIE